MRPILALALSSFLALPLAAQEAASAESVDGAEAPEDPLAAWQAKPDIILDADGIDLGSFKWLARPVVVFADSPFDPAFQEQMALILAEMDQLAARDAVVIVDTDPDRRSEVRRALRPRGFALVLVGKEGRVNLRKPFPWDVREITHAIDKWPMRQQEIRESGS
jgi:hypothetical protein